MGRVGSAKWWHLVDFEQIFCASTKDDFNQCFFSISDWMTNSNKLYMQTLPFSLFKQTLLTFCRIKSSIDLFILVVPLSFLLFCGSPLFPKTKVNQNRYRKISTYLSGVFLSVTVRTTKGLEYQYQQCIKYKPGSNSKINKKVDLQSYFRSKKLNYTLFILIEPPKKLFEMVIILAVHMKNTVI